jgi:hypothetical protein
VCAFNGVLCVGKIDHLKVEVPLMVCKTDLCLSHSMRKDEENIGAAGIGARAKLILYVMPFKYLSDPDASKTDASETNACETNLVRLPPHTKSAFIPYLPAKDQDPLFYSPQSLSRAKKKGFNARP